MVSMPSVAVIGGGPAGLMAAEVLSGAGVRVDLYDAMPSVGRKFLMAGKGGLNITHAEPYATFLSRYGARQPQIKTFLDVFGADELREWVHGLGIATFVGSSQRVFPVDFKAAPLLRAWLHRLRQAGVHFHVRHRWCGLQRDGTLRFETPQGESSLRADAVVLALGGGSWAKLGSDGAWVPLLTAFEVPISPLRPANCGFDLTWSGYFRERFAGQAVKSVVASFIGSDGLSCRQQGELMVTATGIEGGLIYALSSVLRDEIAATGSALIHLDLAPGRTVQRLIKDLSQARGSRSMANHLRSRAGIDGVKAGLLREVLSADELVDTTRLAQTIKALPLRLMAPRPIDEAISTAGGVTFEALDDHLMIRHLPGIFCAGEMLDWEAPTGGYLLTACFSSGLAAGRGVLDWLRDTINAPQLHS